jgi:hypothetical protein
MTATIEIVDTTRLVILRVLVAGLVFVVFFVAVTAEEHRPHIELNPASSSLHSPPMPVASAGIVPGEVIDLAPFD